MDTYNYTQNEARAEILEKQKAEIDAQIADLRMYQAVANAARWAQLDAEIDALFLQKDNLTAGWIAEAEALAADARDEQRTMLEAAQ